MGPEPAWFTHPSLVQGPSQDAHVWRMEKGQVYGGMRGRGLYVLQYNRWRMYKKSRLNLKLEHYTQRSAKRWHMKQVCNHQRLCRPSAARSVSGCGVLTDVQPDEAVQSLSLSVHRDPDADPTNHTELTASALSRSREVWRKTFALRWRFSSGLAQESATCGSRASFK